MSINVDLQVTTVWQRNWEAINARNPDGSRRYKYIVNIGSSRSSKTISLIDLADLYCVQNGNKRFTVWRDTKTDCKKTVLNDTLKRHKATGRYKKYYDFNKTESIFTYRNGSTFEIHGTDDEESVHGLTQDCAWLNEPYNISRATFDQIDQRTADFILVDLNPKRSHWSEDLLKDPRTCVIHSTFRDNPFCPEESRFKILSYQPLSHCSLIRSGLITEADAHSYDFGTNPLGFTDKGLLELERCVENHRKNTASAFNWEVYGLGVKAEKPNRILSWTKIPRAQYDAIEANTAIGVDWGKVDPWGIVELKYYDGAIYVRELNYLSENDLRRQWWHKDPSYNRALGVDPEGLGITVLRFNQLQIPKDKLIVCDSNRPIKSAALRRAGWENAIDASKPKGSIIDGISILQNIPVYFTDDSPNIEYEQENYSYKTDRLGTVLEEPEDKDNHLIDPIRYLALWLQSKGIIRTT